MPALSARHSAMHSLAVFCVDDVLVDGDGAAGVAGVATAGFGGGAEAAPVLHCSTYAFWVTPRPCMPALSARHSAVHSFAVLAKTGGTEMMAHATATPISRPLWIFAFILLISCLLTRCGVQLVPCGSNCPYAATEPRTPGRKKAAAPALFVTAIAFFYKAVFPIRDGLERMRPN